MMADLLLFLEIFGYFIIGSSLAFAGLAPHSYGRSEEELALTETVEMEAGGGRTHLQGLSI